MSAELLVKPTIADLAGGNLISAHRFSPGDNVSIKNYIGVPMKVVGYQKDQRGEERVVVVWFNKELNLVEAGLPEALLVESVEQDEQEYNDAISK